MVMIVKNSFLRRRRHCGRADGCTFIWRAIQAERKLVIRHGQTIPSVPRLSGFDSQETASLVAILGSLTGCFRIL